MKVIGAGMGRTGTSSLQNALEILGFGPCYHMNQVVKEPGSYERAEAWAETLEQSDASRAMELMKGYNSCVDFPSSSLAVELFRKNPNSKIILGVRNNFEEWYASASSTILASIDRPDNPRRELYQRMKYKWFAAFTESKKIPETREEYEISYNTWIKHIKKEIPESQLLLLKPTDGWEPICKFLNLPIPEVDYPSKNDRKTFQERKGVIKE